MRKAFIISKMLKILIYPHSAFIKFHAAINLDFFFGTKKNNRENQEFMVRVTNINLGINPERERQKPN